MTQSQTQPKDKTRVYELARELNIKAVELLTFCKELGIDAKNQLSNLSPEQCDQLRQRVQHGASKPANAAPTLTPTKADLEKSISKIKTLPSSRRSPATTHPVGVEAADEPHSKPDSELVADTTQTAQLADSSRLTTPQQTPTGPAIAADAPQSVQASATGDPAALSTASGQPVAVATTPPQPNSVQADPTHTLPSPAQSVAVAVAPTSAEQKEPTAAPAAASAKIESTGQTVSPPSDSAKPSDATPAPSTPPVVRPQPPLTSRPPNLGPIRNLSGKPPTLTPPRPATQPSAPASQATGTPTSTGPARSQQPPTPTPSVPPTTTTATTSTSTPTAPPSPVAPASTIPGQNRPTTPLAPSSPASVTANRPITPTRPGSGVPTLPARNPTTTSPAPASGSNVSPPRSGDRTPFNRPAPSDRRSGSPQPTGSSSAAPRADTSSGPSRPGGSQPPGLRLTAEQIELMRQGRSLRDILARTRAGSLPSQATPAATASSPAAPAPTTAPPGRDPVRPSIVNPTPVINDVDVEEEEGRGGPKGKGLPGRADRQKARQDRAKKRLSAASIEIIDGHVEAVEDESSVSRSRVKARRQEKRQPGTVERKGKIPLEMPITIRKASEAFGAPIGKLLFKLMEHGIKGLNINSVIDQDIAELLALDFGVEIEIRKPVDLEDELVKTAQAADDPASLLPRAPVVTIMGHVDHGKTSLLDYIRKSRVVDTEAGGITQVLRAWRVERNGKPITFLDTPGHEAFTKMRVLGANVTDIVVIVVAANDGVMPQTEEAISHAKAASVPIIVAINKVDLPNANVKRTEQQLYGLGLIPDNMGGDTPFCYTSAVTGKGIDDLLDMILLVADLRELKANPNKPAVGTCLEAHLSGDEGVFATLLVQQGTLHRSDIVLCGSAYGRVRAMYDDLGRIVSEAGPSVPVRITGLDEVPDANDRFYVVDDLSKAREIAEQRRKHKQEASLIEKARVPFTLETMGQAKIAELKVIIKADYRGSIEAIRKELEKLVHEEVRVRVLHTGIGAINVSDVQLAMTSPQDTIIVGFNVVPDNEALTLAQAHSIQIREYNIIYNLTDDIKQALAGKLKPREEVVHLGRAVVQQVFKISKVGTIAGCMVTQGVIERNAKVRVIRDGAVIYPPADRTAGLESLRRHKDDVREVREGFDCGLKIAGYDDVKVGDVIEAFRIEQIQRTL